ncbi:MAG: exonuclease SbcCD subunit D [Oscillospiraceae bacterium]|jgi:exonuclease SbcD|nr:exonuclease SbcCD subunit D [Oscillospiraceae bacterium]
MKFIHLADLHLGKKLNEWNLIEDQKYILDQISSLCEQRGVDAVLICGDVYDKRVPPPDAVELLDAFLTNLVRQGRQVIMISGNHDSAERLDFASRLLAAEGLHISGRFNGKAAVATLNDEYGRVHFWSLPFARLATLSHAMPDADASSYSAAFCAAVATARINPDERNVLLAHQFVIGGGSLPLLGGSEQFFSLPDVGSVEAVDARAFDAFDYVALGHIHKTQSILRETIRYAGAPLQYHLDEAGQGKSVPLVVMEGKGSVSVELVPLRPLRSVRHITGPIDILLRQENVIDADDYIYATLTDDIPVLDAIAKVRAIYPRTLHLDYQKRNITSPGALDIDEREFRGRSLVDHFESFYYSLYREQPSEDALEIVRAAAERVEDNLNEA